MLHQQLIGIVNVAMFNTDVMFLFLNNDKVLIDIHEYTGKKNECGSGKEKSVFDFVDITAVSVGDQVYSRLKFMNMW